MKDLVNTQLIKNYINDNKLTKTAFCKRCKISIGTLNRIFSEKNVDIRAIFKIARIMNKNICDLFN